jgi:aspartyl-tRNA(Asn)/glutamyl-tRNA(Gln) amidotransferase subunit C
MRGTPREARRRPANRLSGSGVAGSSAATVNTVKGAEMTAISRTEVAHLARLARLAVTDEELDVFSGQLDVILTSIARIGEVAAGDIPPTSHSVPLTNVLRDDVEVPCLTREEALAGAPDTAEDRFRVPRILDEE